MSATGLRYRRFRAGDVARARALSLAVHWPHRVEDWEFARRLGTGFVAEDKGGVVGTILCWKHDARGGTLGLVIVAPEAQGRGIGRELMRRALAELGDRAVVLHGTTAGQTLYASFGFRPVGEVIQYQGIAGHVPAAPLPRGERLRPVGRSDAPKLVQLGMRATGISRAAAIAALLEAGEAIVLDRGGEPVGFAAYRRFGKGFLIGPVVASDTRRAKALIGHWVATKARQFIRIDVDATARLGTWLGRIGLAEAGRVLPMVRGALPKRDAKLRQFAITSQALG
jgi:GNAT superfamily N-acetyltransferase